MSQQISKSGIFIQVRNLGAVQDHETAWDCARADLRAGGVSVVLAVHERRVHSFVYSDTPTVHAGEVAMRLAIELGGEGGGMPDKAHGAGPDKMVDPADAPALDEVAQRCCASATAMLEAA